MKLLIPLSITILFATGCSNTTSVSIDGQEFQKDANGAVMMTQADYDTLKSNDQSEVVTPPTLNVTEEEYELLKTNGEALFSLAGMANNNESVSTLIKKGSAKHNIQRMMTENGWGQLYFEGQDYFVGQSYILESEGVETAVLEILDQEPVYACFDAEDRSVTIIKANVENLLYETDSKKVDDQFASINED